MVLYVEVVLVGSCVYHAVGRLTVEVFILLRCYLHDTVVGLSALT